MSKYTTQIRFICETAAGLNDPEEHKTLEEIIQAGVDSIFDFDYPIFDEAYRNVLETKIVKHYYTREIGEETVGLWKLRLNSTMNEIMPYYNKLYSSELLEFNPLYDVDYTREGNRETTEQGEETAAGTNSRTDRMTGTVSDAGTTSNTDHMTGTVEDTTTEESTSSGSSTKATTNSGTDTENTTSTPKNSRWDYYSDTPQGTIGSVPGGGQAAIEGQTYLTNVRHIVDDGTGSTGQTTTLHGHAINETGSNSGTVETEGSATKEYNTTNTGSGQSSNTKTYNTTNTDTGTTSENKSRELSNLQDYAERVSGKMGGTSYSKLLLEFRETFLNIDMRIINDLSTLFFGLWE